MVVDATALRAVLLLKLRQAGAREPEDGAHDIIVRLLASGMLDEDHTPAYWWVAARNMARDQAVKAWRFVPWGEGIDVVDTTGPDKVEPDLSGLNLAAKELAWLLAYYEAPRGECHKDGRSVKAFRLRKKAKT